MSIKNRKLLGKWLDEAKEEVSVIAVQFELAESRAEDAERKLPVSADGKIIGIGDTIWVVDEDRMPYDAEHPFFGDTVDSISKNDDSMYKGEGQFVVSGRTWSEAGNLRCFSSLEAAMMALSDDIDLNFHIKYPASEDEARKAQEADNESA